MKFSIGSFIGFSICLGFITLGLMDTSGSIKLEHFLPDFLKNPFIHFAGFFIVFGGVLGAMFIMYPTEAVLKALASFRHIFNHSNTKTSSMAEDVEMIVSWSDKMKADKKSFLQEMTDKNKEPFVRMLFDLLSTNYSSQDIRNMGEVSIDKEFNKSLQMSDVIHAMANSAPAFGMVGTVLGMVVMLSNLDDPANIGPGISTGLIGTLYGVTSANLFFIPLSRKIKFNAMNQQRREILILEGLLLIKENKQALVIRDQLMSFVSRDNDYEAKPVK